MLEKILAPFTTAKASGTLARSLFELVGALIAVAGILGYLSAEQIEALNEQIKSLTANLPLLLAALGTVMTAGMQVYRALFKSSSDKAAAAAKVIDKKLPKQMDVQIKPVDPAGPAPAGGIVIKANAKK